MSCYTCSTEFGFLKREIGCESCGFAFCSRCCKKRQVASETGEFKKQSICNSCYAKSVSDKANPSRSPPLAHKIRMEALKKQSFSVDSGYQMPVLTSKTDDEKDKEIAARLQRLKRDRIKDELPSNTEIEERLAKLKGIDPAKYKAPPIEVFRPTDRRTSVEKASDLMEQIKGEVDLDSRLVKPEDEIAEQLARLRDELPKKKQTEHSPDDPSVGKADAERGSETESDIEEEANKLVEKLMATNIEDEVEELESSDGQDGEKLTPKSDEEEFPWCVICTEDAKIRCFNCDGDLYCMRCFKECHDSFDIAEHRTCPFLPTKKSL